MGQDLERCNEAAGGDAAQSPAASGEERSEDRDEHAAVSESEEEMDAGSESSSSSSDGEPAHRQKGHETTWNDCMQRNVFHVSNTVTGVVNTGRCVHSWHTA